MRLFQTLSQEILNFHIELLFMCEYSNLFFYVPQAVDLDSIKCFIYIFRTFTASCKYINNKWGFYVFHQSKQLL